jgi:hypothetical protein
MMKADRPVRDGALVCSFLLTSDAGQLLHPAHLDPAHIVHIVLDHPSAFRFRQLVWATGFLMRTKERPRYGEWAWAVVHGRAEPAPEEALVEWFQP